MLCDFETSMSTALPPPPKTFRVTESARPTSADNALVRVDGGPYRDLALAATPGLSIEWRADDFHISPGSGAVLSNLVWWGSSATLVILAILGRISQAGLAISETLLVIILGALYWWRKSRWVRADHEGLHWRGISWMTRSESQHLLTPDLAQLVVRRKLDDGDPYFVVHARDRGGREHVIASFTDAEQAWWLEARLEQHFGLVHRRIAGEHCREPPLLPAPLDPDPV